MKKKSFKKNDTEVILAQILEALPVMVFAKDIKNDFKFLIWNQTAEKIIGHNSEDMLGKSDYDFFPKEQADFFRKKDVETCKMEGVLEMSQEEISTPSGKRVLRTKKTVIRDSKGEGVLLLGVSEDITALVVAEELAKQERAKSVQNAKLALLGEMSAGIAHEINNPLAAISGNLHLIDHMTKNLPELQKKTGQIAKSVRRISKIISSLKKFSRVSEDREYRLISLKDIVKESLLLTGPKSKDTSVPVHFDSMVEAFIFCDEIEIEQVLVNLISNGMDAVKNLDSNEKWVKVNIVEKDDFVVLQVKDSGKGISEEVKKKLFWPFFTTKPAGEGTGLGLSIVKGILDEHNASIEVLNNDPNTCFEIKFKKGQVNTRAA